MPAATSISNPQFNTLYVELTKRLVETGEWDRLRSVLAVKLNESGWKDDILDQSKERARNMEPLSFKDLLAEVKPIAHSSIPQPIRREVATMIRQLLEKHCE